VKVEEEQEDEEEVEEEEEEEERIKSRCHKIIRVRNTTSSVPLLRRHT
jgi:hypothetical protein